VIRQALWNPWWWCKNYPACHRRHPKQDVTLTLQPQSTDLSLDAMKALQHLVLMVSPGGPTGIASDMIMVLYKNLTAMTLMGKNCTLPHFAISTGSRQRCPLSFALFAPLAVGHPCCPRSLLMQRIATFIPHQYCLSVMVYLVSNQGSEKTGRNGLYYPWMIIDAPVLPSIPVARNCTNLGIDIFALTHTIVTYHNLGNALNKIIFYLERWYIPTEVIK